MSLLTRQEALLIMLGVAGIVLGVIPGVTFYPGLPGPRTGSRAKPLPRWLGRLWFISVGALMLYWGVKRLL